MMGKFSFQQSLVFTLLAAVATTFPDFAFARDQTLPTVSIEQSFSSPAKLRTNVKIVALVIGESNYVPIVDGRRGWQPLRHAEADANLVASHLIELGVPEHNIITISNGDKNQIEKALAKLQYIAKDADTVLIFYSGHGRRIANVDYLIPTDAPSDLDSAISVSADTIPVSELPLSVADISSKPQTFIFIDACRDKVDASMATQHSQRTTDDLPPDVFIQYSAAAGEQADDGAGEHSAYVTALVKLLDKTKDVIELNAEMEDELGRRPAAKQHVTMRSSLSSQRTHALFPAGPVSGASESTDANEAAWALTEAADNAATYRVYLELHPNGPRALSAQQRLRILQSAPVSENAKGNAGDLATAIRSITDQQWGAVDNKLIVTSVLHKGDFASLQALAATGDAKAQNMLGIAYEYGVGTTQDFNEARRWYGAAANQGYAYAQINLGDLLKRGQGVAQDYSQAKAWFEKAAAQDNVEAEVELAVLYRDGIGVPADRAKAVQLYRKAAERGNGDGQVGMGLAALLGWDGPKDTRSATEWFQKAIDQGDVEGEAVMGLAYEAGGNVPVDFNKAKDWLKKAADYGLPWGQASLGDLYLREEWPGHSDTIAAEWFQKAADQGDSTGFLDLGMLYTLGRGVPKDAAKGFDYFHKAADLNNPLGQTLVAEHYIFGKILTGDAVPPLKDALSNASPADMAAGISYLTSAGEGGSELAQLLLGVFYLNGKGVSQDYGKAVYWLRKAADQGLAEGQGVLAMMYFDGKGVKQDPAEARNWFRKAADQGNTFSMMQLGYIFESGDGAPVDLAQARQWYTKAADKGDATGEMKLAEAYESGTGGPKDLSTAFDLFQKAAAGGAPGADGHVGWFYENGTVVAKDVKAAQQWYQKGAIKDDPLAQYYLGMSYVYDANPDCRSGVDWLEKSAQSSLAAAESELSVVYYNGCGTGYSPAGSASVPSDMYRARYWAQLASVKDVPVANFFFGLLLQDGKGGSQDTVQAFKMFKKAADEGVGAAQERVGYYYEIGIVVERDYSQARAWYLKAAQNGNFASAGKLSEFYSKGLGGEKDAEKSNYWLAKSKPTWN